MSPSTRRPSALKWGTGCGGERPWEPRGAGGDRHVTPRPTLPLLVPPLPPPSPSLSKPSPSLSPSLLPILGPLPSSLPGSCAQRPRRRESLFPGLGALAGELLLACSGASGTSPFVCVYTWDGEHSGLNMGHRGKSGRAEKPPAWGELLPVSFAAGTQWEPRIWKLSWVRHDFTHTALPPPAAALADPFLPHRILLGSFQFPAS